MSSLWSSFCGRGLSSFSFCGAVAVSAGPRSPCGAVACSGCFLSKTTIRLVPFRCFLCKAFSFVSMQNTVKSVLFRWILCKTPYTECFFVGSYAQHSKTSAFSFVPMQDIVNPVLCFVFSNAKHSNTIAFSLVPMQSIVKRVHLRWFLCKTQ